MAANWSSDNRMVKPVVQARLRYVRAYTDNRGKLRIYFRRPGHPQVALPAPIGGPAFVKAYAAALAATEPQRPRIAAAGSLEAVAVSWLQSPAFLNLAASTQAVQRRILTRLRKDHGHRMVRLATPADVQALVSARADTPAAANHVLRLLRALFAHAIKLGLRPDNPAAQAERLAERQQGHPDWPDDVIALYRAKWPVGSKQRLALELIIQTAQRKSDALRLGRQNLTDGGSALRFRQIKTGADMVIPITPELSACIAALPPGQMLFLTTEAGQAYTVNGFYNAFRDWCDEAGVPRGYSAHGLRKARARQLAEAGATPHQIMAWTGHKTLAEVERYTRAASQLRLARQTMARTEIG